MIPLCFLVWHWLWVKAACIHLPGGPSLASVQELVGHRHCCSMVPLPRGLFKERFCWSQTIHNEPWQVTIGKKGPGSGVFPGVKSRERQWWWLPASDPLSSFPFSAQPTLPGCNSTAFSGRRTGGRSAVTKSLILVQLSRNQRHWWLLFKKGVVGRNYMHVFVFRQVRLHVCSTSRSIPSWKSISF